MKKDDSYYYMLHFDYEPEWTAPEGQIRTTKPLKFNVSAYLDGIKVLELLGGDLRPEMVQALRRCHRNFRTACLTNNMKGLDETDIQQLGRRASEMQAVMDIFDYVVESSEIGFRKPDPRFYQIACEIVEIAPVQVVFLDDLGVNLKPARAMGMTTIKVTDPHRALAELEALLGLTLTG